MYINLIEWFIANWIEVFATVSGFIYILLSVKQNIWLWPVGFVTSALFVFVFFKATLYADMCLQIYYLLVSVYGWYHWLFGKNKNIKTGSLKIFTLKPYQWILAILATLLMGLAIYYITHKYTNASNPMWDGLITAGSITATWMLARKILEQWIIWVIVDGASIALFIVKGLYLTSILTLVYTIMAIYGYYSWRKIYLNQNG